MLEDIYEQDYTGVLIERWESELPVEDWEEEFMHESEREYERVPATQFWEQDLCDPSFIHSLSRDEFDQI